MFRVTWSRGGLSDDVLSIKTADEAAARGVLEALMADGRSDVAMWENGRYVRGTPVSRKEGKECSS